MRRALLAAVTLALGFASRAHAQTLNVFAAASLKESITRVAKDFEHSHRGVSVSLNFGGSQQLAAQINAGAPADVFLSAGLEPLASVKFETNSMRIFATNRLALIVPISSQKVRKLEDLSKGFSIVVADSRVPVGHYTDLMLEKLQARLGKTWVANFNRNVVSREQDVRAVLAKIALGEADAGVVYTTDAATARGKVRVIPISPRDNIDARYPAVRFTNSPSPALAKDFVKTLTQKGGQKVLAYFGFGIPGAPVGKTH